MQIILSTVHTDPGVSYRNYLGMCIDAWEPMEKTAHGYIILGWGVGVGFKLMTNLKETKEAKCKQKYGVKQ